MIPTTILSLCVGGIPAIIGAAARSATDVVELGVEFMPACLKVGVASIQRDKLVEDSEDGCWGYVIKQLPSEEIQKAINEFHRMRVSYQSSFLPPPWEPTPSMFRMLSKLRNWTDQPWA